MQADWVVLVTYKKDCKTKRVIRNETVLQWLKVIFTKVAILNVQESKYRITNSMPIKVTIKS